MPDLPERNDVKNLWDGALKENHKRLLYEIAKAGVHGLSQAPTTCPPPRASRRDSRARP